MKEMYALLVLFVFCMTPFSSASGENRMVNNHPERKSSIDKDFVHGECVFDTLYPVFMRMYPTVSILNGKTATGREDEDWLRSTFGFVHMTPSWHHGDVPSIEHRGGRMYFSEEAAPFGSVGPTVDSLGTRIRRAVKWQRAQTNVSLKEMKNTMVSQLEAFADTATVLPTVYALIATKYGGDVRAYVDDLFDRSVMTSRRRLRRFARYPNVDWMQRDMGFQFVVSKLMYRLWEAQGRSAQPAADGTRLVVLRSELP